MAKTLNDVFGSVGADAKLVAQVKANTKDIVSLNQATSSLKETKLDKAGGIVTGQFQLSGGTGNDTSNVPMLVNGDGQSIFPTIGFNQPNKFLGASLSSRKQNEISVMASNGSDLGRLHTGFLNVHGKNDAITFQGGQIKSNGADHLQLNGNQYAFLTSPKDVHLCNNSYWNGVDWKKHDDAKASSYLVLDAANGVSVVPVLRYSDAGSENPNQHAGYFYGQFNKPKRVWRQIWQGTWSANQTIDFGMDMRNRLIMFEVSHLGGGATAITALNDGSAQTNYWVYGNWEYGMQWVGTNALKMAFVIANTGSPIYRVWIEDYE